MKILREIWEWFCNLSSSESAAYANLRTFESMKDNDYIELKIKNIRRDAFRSKHRDRILYFKELCLIDKIPPSELIYLLEREDYEEARSLGIVMLFGVELRPKTKTHD